MKIRLAEKKDAQVIAKVHIDTWRSAYKGIMSDSFLNSLDLNKFTNGWLKTLSTQGEGNYLVVESEGTIIAFCTFGSARDEDLDNTESAELVAINVSPLYWRKEVGSQLLINIINRLKENYSTLYLWVAEKNVNATSFYIKHGFKAEGKTKVDTGHGGIVEHRYMLKLC